jgi:uncharacterized protein
MRLVYTADLHGNIAAFRHLFNFAASTGAEAAIVGGDLFPPGIRVAEGIARQRAFIEQELRPLLEQFRRDYPHVMVYLLAGNDDWAGATLLLDQLETEGLARPLHNRVYFVRSDLALAGYACVPLTPYSIKDYERLEDKNPPLYSFAMAYTSAGGMVTKTSFGAMLSMPTISAELEQLARRSAPSRTIYVCHAPPHNTALDAVRGRHAGSKAIREFIETYQPPLTLHGHIHEAPQTSHCYAEQLGRTWAVNPGHDRQQFGAIYLDTADIANTMQHTIYGPLVGSSVREVGR